MLNILVCDDERAWCEIVYTYIKDFFDQVKLKVALHPFFGKRLSKIDDFVREKRIDIAFLDIDLQEQSYFSGKMTSI